MSNITLLPHQIEDAKFLSERKFAGNFSGMGSGKTLTALEAAKQVISLGDTVLIVGPPISLFMWAEEFEDYLGIPAQIIKTGKQAIKYGPGAVIMSYEIATKRRDELKQLGAKVLIMDESHAIKSPAAKRTKALIGKGGLCESVSYTWLLSGTPSTRWNDDLFTFMARAGNGQLKEKIGDIDLERFRLRYCVVQKKRFSGSRFPVAITVGNRNTEELNEMLFSGGLAVRRELAEVFENMPPLTTNRLTVELDSSPELKGLLKSLEKKTMNEIREDLASKEEHLATTRRLLGMAKVKHSVKEIVSRIEAGVTPILVGAWHTDVIDLLHEKLFEKGLTQIAIIDGRTSSQSKQAFTKGFNDGTLDVLIGQISAMGVSLNLQGGSHIICVEEDWSPAVMSQFFARCHRLGQKSHVHVDIFQSDTKLDKAVRRISQAKAKGHNTLMEQDDDA